MEQKGCGWAVSGAGPHLNHTPSGIETLLTHHVLFLLASRSYVKACNSATAVSFIHSIHLCISITIPGSNGLPLPPSVLFSFIEQQQLAQSGHQAPSCHCLLPFNTSNILWWKKGLRALPLSSTFKPGNFTRQLWLLLRAPGCHYLRFSSPAIILSHIDCSLGIPISLTFHPQQL